MALGAFYMVLGRISEACEKLVHSLRLNPLSIRAHRLLGLALTIWAFCRMHMSLGDSEKAIHFLERSFEERSTVALFASFDPILKSLRTDPRFHRIIASLHLPTTPRSNVAKL